MGRLSLSLIILIVIYSCSIKSQVSDKNSIRNDNTIPSVGLCPPFAPFKDTNMTGYKIWYETRINGKTIFDTIPHYRSYNGKKIVDAVYEAYVYKGLPRITKQLAYFYQGKYYYNNIEITDFERWDKQNELGLKDPPLFIVIRS